MDLGRPEVNGIPSAQLPSIIGIRSTTKLRRDYCKALPASSSFKQTTIDFGTPKNVKNVTSQSTAACSSVVISKWILHGT
jgi:hypothetical protein